MTIIEAPHRVYVVYPGEVCSTCWGSGEENEYEPCDFCGGSGLGDDEVSECEECDGTGEVRVDDECPECHGHGHLPEVPGTDDAISLLSDMMQTIADRGIGVTVPDGEPGRCCGGCIAAAAVKGVRGGWVGFHEQSLETLLEHGVMYLNHDLPDVRDAKFVFETLGAYGTVQWDGERTSAIRFRLPAGVLS